MNRDNDARPFAPPFVRLNYYHGQMLSAQDFRAEQAYFREKRRLLNRMVLGHGIVSGLEVGRGLIAAEDCSAQQGDLLEKRTEIARQEHRHQMLLDSGCVAEAAEVAATLADLREELGDLEVGLVNRQGVAGAAPAPRGLIIGQGYALDCRGNDIVVRNTVTVDPNAVVDDATRSQWPETGLMQVSICYDEEPIHPTRPMGAEPCDDPGEVFFARVREAVRIKLSLYAEGSLDAAHAAEPCGAGEGCACTCLSLALVPFKRNADGTLAIEDGIDNSARRPLALYAPTRIVSLNWAHGATYGWNQTPALMQGSGDDGGLEVRFSRPIVAETLIDGVVDVVLTTGGDGMAGSIRHIACGVELREGGRVLCIRQKSRERFNPGDRITVTIRASHLLDRCGRPVLGGNLGGLVPRDSSMGGPEPARVPERSPAAFKPIYRHFQPWATGAAGDFVSWIHIGEEVSADAASDS